MNDDIILSDLRRRIVQISEERDVATLALSHEQLRHEEKTAPLRAAIRALRREVAELNGARVRAAESQARVKRLERELDETRAKLERALSRAFAHHGGDM